MTPIFVAVTSGQNHKSCSDKKMQEKVIETIAHSGEASFQEIFYFAVVFQGGMCLCSFLMRHALLHVFFVPLKRSPTLGPEIRSRFLHTIRGMKIRDNYVF